VPPPASGGSSSAWRDCDTFKTFGLQPTVPHHCSPLALLLHHLDSEANKEIGGERVGKGAEGAAHRARCRGIAGGGCARCSPPPDACRLRACPAEEVLQVHLAFVSIRQHTPAYVSICQHTSAYASIRQHTPAPVTPWRRRSKNWSMRTHI
jgi:hypothetical protein